MGFFVEGMCGPGNKDVFGRLVAIPGLTQGGGSVYETAAFLRYGSVGAVIEKDGYSTCFRTSSSSTRSIGSWSSS